jgi:thiol-disulfide isomerase/thioredoxin
MFKLTSQRFQKGGHVLATLGVLLISGGVFAQNKPLKVGDHAPQFRVGKWVKGSPISGLKQGHAYVVEFWATRCGPCVAGIPHLSGLAKKYKGKLDIAAVSVLHWQDGSPNDTPALVSDFMKTANGRAMAYHVAEDTSDGFMIKKWFAAAGFDGIPAAFVVNKNGRVAWMGSPLDLDPVLEKIFAHLVRG